jgi:hypothetical protein
MLLGQVNWSTVNGSNNTQLACCDLLLGPPATLCANARTVSLQCIFQSDGGLKVSPIAVHGPHIA